MTEALPGKHEGSPGHFLDELRETFASQASRTAIHYKDRIVDLWRARGAGPALLPRGCASWGSSRATGWRSPPRRSCRSWRPTWERSSRGRSRCP